MAKRPNKERTTLNFIKFLESQRLPSGYHESLYKTGWNSALDTLIAKVKDGAHTPEYQASEARIEALEKAEEQKRATARHVRKDYFTLAADEAPKP